MMGFLWKAIKWCVLYPMGFFMAIGLCISGPGAVSAAVCVTGLVLVFHNWGNKQVAKGPLQTFEFDMDMTARVEVRARCEEDAEAMLEKFRADDQTPRGVKVASVSVT